jgi:hypothetical protein
MNNLRGEGFRKKVLFVWYLWNSTTNGIAEMISGWGTTGNTPIVGDWNGT